MSATAPRTLVAGFGNVLRADDGFGVEVIRRLHDHVEDGSGVSLCDVGTGGIRLAQELLGSYDRLIVVDAMARGGAPGTVYVLAVESVKAAADIDMHVAVPSRALAVAQALGALPTEVWMVGCEPEMVDDLRIGLTPRVGAAVDVAIGHILQLIDGIPAPSTAGGETHA